MKRVQVSATSSSSRQRVLVLGSTRPDTVGDSYRRALEGHYDVTLVDPYELITVSPPRWTRLPLRTFSSILETASNIVAREPLALMFPRLVRAARELQPDICVVTTMDALPPRVVREIKTTNPAMKIFGVFSDAISNFGRGYFFDAPYDALFFKDHFIVDKLRVKLGWKHAFYLPQACDAGHHRPVALTDEDRARYECDVTIAGNLHYFRLVQLNALLGRDLKIYGGFPSRWMGDQPLFKHHMGYEVTGEQKCKAMLGARIVLNNNHYAEISGTNKRTFEMAAIGAFQLTDTPALSDVFVPNEEVAVFDSLEDMVEKVDHYLARPEERQVMAERARARALREHTYAHRWTAHMLAMGLEVPSAFPVQAEGLVHRAR